MSLKLTRNTCSGTLLYWSIYENTLIFFLAGDVAEAVRHARTIRNQIRHAQSLDSAELFSYAKELRVPFELLQKTAQMGRLPVVNFAAGGLGKYMHCFNLSLCNQ